MALISIKICSTYLTSYFESCSFIEEWPEMHVYVKSFGGFAKEQDWLSEAEKLTEAIADKDKINTNYWFSAGYNSPFQLIGRTNEIWLVKK
jgi:hypothetical protein